MTNLNIAETGNMNMISKTWTRVLFVIATICVGFSLSALNAAETNLPKREGQRPQTTDSVPHVQIGVKRNPETNEALLLKVSKLAGVEIRPTILSLPGAMGFWLDESLNLAHPEIIIRGREFAHSHPDGSLHAALPEKLAKEAVDAGWATFHPWADQNPGWEGFVMIYTPQNDAQLDVVYGLIEKSYEFITGKSAKASQ